MNDVVLRWCEDGHTWIDQSDGTVSPSWGLGGTHMPVDDPLLCPEPRRNEDGAIYCADCGEWKWRLGDCLRGLSFTPWEKEDWCAPPAPACLKPAIGANAWRDQHLPFDQSRWCSWWVRRDGPWRLTFHQGHHSRMWAATYDCIDVHTGERFEVNRTWTARRARIEEYPAYLRQRWWTTSGGKLLGCWSTMAPGGAGFLIEGRAVREWVLEAVRQDRASVGCQLSLDV